MEYDLWVKMKKGTKGYRDSKFTNNNSNNKINSHFMINDIYFDFLSVNKKKVTEPKNIINYRPRKVLQ